MVRADLAEFVRDGLLRQLGPVAIAAEMREEHVTKFVAGDIAGEGGGGIIAEVAVAAHDALLQGPGTRGVFLQELQVVVGFHDQHIHLTDAFGDELGGVAEVGQHADGEAGSRVANDVADRIVGVMRDGEGFDEQITDLERPARGKQAPGNPDGRRPFRVGRHGLGGETIGVDGQGARLAQDAEATHVIGMLVREDHAADLVDVAVDEREAPGDLTTAEAGIDKKSRRVGFDQSAITGAATTQNRDVHPHAPIVHGGRNDSSFLQLEERDFGRTVEPHGRGDHADAAVDVHLRLAADEQPVGVLLSVMRRDMRRAVKGNDDLAAVGVTGQNQVRTFLPPVFKGIGVVHQHERERRIDIAKGADHVHAVRPIIAEADDGERLAVDADCLAGVAENGNADGFDGGGDGIAAVPVIMIAQRGEHAIFGTGLAHALGARVYHFGWWGRFLVQKLDQPADMRIVTGKVVANGQIIARENHEVGREGIGRGDAFGEVLRTDHAAAVKIGKMSDGEAIKRGRKSLNDNWNATDVGEAGFDER